MAFSPPDSDRLFRQAIGVPLVARQFLLAWLPREFLEVVDWSTLEVLRVTGIDPGLSERREDVVYGIRAAGSEVRFYVLIEHQSQPDPLMALRVMEYTLSIWREARREARGRGVPKRPLPLVVPVVLYPGPGRWTAQRQLRVLIDIPEKLAEWASGFAPQASFLVAELGSRPLERLADGHLARAVLGALKGQRRGKLGFEEVRSLVGELFSEEQREAALALAGHLWHYLIEHSELREEEVDAIVDGVVPEERKQDFMSTAEVLRQAGRQEGMQQGLQRGLIEAQRAAIVDVLDVRFGHVPDEVREAVGVIVDLARLAALHRAAVVCESIEAFARDL